MKKTQEKTNFFFVDESGDPTFYDRYGNLILGNEGVSKILILGFINTNNPKLIRSELNKTRKNISGDMYLQGIPSLEKSVYSFHAKDDCPEVREKVFKCIAGLNFSSELFIARKIKNVFNIRHHGNENEFYFDLISKLFENKLHLSTKNEIYFAIRGSKSRQIPLTLAIEKSINKFEAKWKKKLKSDVKIYPQSPSGEPCLQVIDYINWAVQRAFVKKDIRYYRFVESKIKFMVDIYDTEKYPRNYYSRKNRFEINKISPL